MALIVETGEGVANAESYATVAEASTRLAARGDTVWAGLSDPVREGALRRATDYMQGEYAGRWLGLKSTTTQALDHPRMNVPIADVYNTPGTITYYDVDELIVAVKNACIDLALKAHTGELAPDIERGLIQDTVGPLTQKWDKGSSQKVRFRAIDDMLAALLKPRGFSVTTGRA